MSHVDSFYVSRFEFMRVIEKIYAKEIAATFNSNMYTKRNRLRNEQFTLYAISLQGQVLGSPTS